MILNEWLTKIKQWWADMREQPESVEQTPVEQPEPVEQAPVEQPEPPAEKSKKKSRSPAKTTKKPKTPRKTKETGDKKSGKAKAKKT